MKILNFKDEEAWLDARRGKITGTRLKGLINKTGKKKKIGFYEIIAERVAIPASGENVMDRGHRLEEDAILRFEKETGKKVDSDLVIWQRDDEPSIALSPDGSVGKTVGVEVKCLSSARHIEAWLTQKVPVEYKEQGMQYFIVNDSMKTLFFVFYDPRMPKDFFYLTINRKDVQKEIDEYLQLQRDVLAEIAEIEKQLTF